MRSDALGPKLGDLVTLIRGTTYKGSLLGQPGPVLLGLASIQRNGGFRGDSLRTYGGECKAKILLRSGDMYVSLKDVTQSADLLGAVARLPENVASGRLTQDTVKLEFVESSYPRDLVYWALRTPSYRSYCRECATGTTTLGLAREDFLSFGLPPVTEESLLLVDLLEALESRILRLAETNITLEAIAQALFKSWFVDFDPVHAKAEGREPEAMDAATAALFPSKFEESELGLIPKGWRERSLDSVANYLNGLALQKFPAESESEFLPVIKIAQLRAGNATGSDRASAHLKPEYVVHDGDVLFSWSGSLEVEFWCGGDGALNQHLFKVTSTEVPKWFYYLATRLHLPEFRRVAASKATTMGHIQRKHLAQAKVTIPPPQVLAAATKFIAPLLDRRITNSLQMREFAQLRDTLLPRLISGKLRLPEAVEATEAALA